MFKAIEGLMPDKYETAREYVERQLMEQALAAEAHHVETGEEMVSEIEHTIRQTLLAVKAKMIIQEKREKRIWTILLWFGFTGIVLFCWYQGLIGGF